MTMPKLQRTILKEKKKTRLPGIARISSCTILVLFAVFATAQSNKEAAPTTQAAPSVDATPTLHVYTNLKQVPVLVLTHDYERMKPIDPSGFRLSLDSGPRFRPTYVRREGNDPISLAILIDASKPDNVLLPSLIQAIAALPPDFLHPQDRVSVYAIDCTLIRTTYDTAANPAVLADGVRRAMTPWQVRQEQSQELKKQKKVPPPPCEPTMRLWDSMAEVLSDLDQQPGRRVLLAITDGEDTGSRTLWKDVMLHAQLHTETVFGLLPIQIIVANNRQEVPEIFHVFVKNIEDKFGQICMNSGGVQLQASEHTTIYRLKEFTEMLRERYILEFPRATNEEAGVHTLAVTYKKKGNLYISAAGITVPIASEEERTGANTIQSDPSQAPTEGDRKVLLHKQ
jgi:hypothetical protein